MQRRGLIAAGLSSAVTGAAAVTGCAARSQPLRALRFPGTSNWLNGQGQAGGHATVVYFWTYSCINSLRPMTYLNRWYADYAAAGLGMIGIHTPEFGFEHQLNNFEWAVSSLSIRHPVSQDNSYETWHAWQNAAWPTFYLLDAEGRLLDRIEGEGHAQLLERRIRMQLNLGPSGSRNLFEEPDFSRIGSPEIYYGAIHPTPQEPSQSPRLGLMNYRFTGHGPQRNHYELEGDWLRSGEALVMRSAEGGLRMRYIAAKVHLVAGATEGSDLLARTDGGAWRGLTVDRPALRTLVEDQSYAERLLDVKMRGAGLTLYSSTFG